MDNVTFKNPFDSPLSPKKKKKAIRTPESESEYLNYYNSIN